MARQCGPVRISGGFDGICYYRSGVRYYARAKSSLSGQRFREDSCFRRSRESCQRFAKGNSVASHVYRSLGVADREYAVFCRLKSMAIRLFREGMREKEVIAILRKEAWLISKGKVKRSQKVRPKTPKGLRIKNSQILILKKPFIVLWPPDILPNKKRCQRYAPMRSDTSLN